MKNYASTSIENNEDEIEEECLKIALQKFEEKLSIFQKKSSASFDDFDYEWFEAIACDLLALGYMERFKKLVTSIQPELLEIQLLKKIIKEDRAIISAHPDDGGRREVLNFFAERFYALQKLMIDRPLQFCGEDVLENSVIKSWTENVCKLLDSINESNEECSKAQEFFNILLEKRDKIISDKSLNIGHLKTEFLDFLGKERFSELENYQKSIFLGFFFNRNFLKKFVKHDEHERFGELISEIFKEKDWYCKDEISNFIYNAVFGKKQENSILEELSEKEGGEVIKESFIKVLDNNFIFSSYPSSPSTPSSPATPIVNGHNLDGHDSPTIPAVALSPYLRSASLVRSCRDRQSSGINKTP
jgi:hypothetical protein